MPEREVVGGRGPGGGSGGTGSTGQDKWGRPEVQEDSDSVCSAASACSRCSCTPGDSDIQVGKYSKSDMAVSRSEAAAVRIAARFLHVGIPLCLPGGDIVMLHQISHIIFSPT